MYALPVVGLGDTLMYGQCMASTAGSYIDIGTTKLPVGLVLLAHTLIVGLQNFQWSWMIHQCMTSVWPVTLAPTLALELQNFQCSWLLH